MTRAGGSGGLPMAASDSGDSGIRNRESHREEHVRTAAIPDSRFRIPAPSRLAHIALSHARREFPNKLDHVLGRRDDALPPRALHPVFYGSYDWHSNVHTYRMLA